MGKVTFANYKVNETISGESRKWQSHITSAGVFDTGSLAAEVAENLKDSAAYVETVLREATNVSKRHLALGERVTIDGLCRLEIAAEGASPAEDAPWDPAVNRLVVNAIAYDGVKFAAKNLVPENVMKPVAIQLLGAQDATTFEQNAVVKGHTLLCQGKGIKLTAANADEGLYSSRRTVRRTSSPSPARRRAKSTRPSRTPFRRGRTRSRCADALATARTACSSRPASRASPSRRAKLWTSDTTS